MHPRLNPWKRALWLTAAALLAGLAGCDDGGGGDDPPAARWTLVADGLPTALLGIWGGGEADVWAVGAADAEGGTVLHYDGTAWTRVPAPDTGDLWWVYGDGAGTVWIAGAQGVVLRGDPGGLTRVIGPSEAYLFGVFPAPDGSVWAVGVQSDGMGARGGELWRLDGDRFVLEDVPAEAAAAGAFFKVWGRSAEDLWVVGLGGVALHRTAAGWTTHDTPRGRRLLTVHGNATESVAVGGFIDALVVSLGDGAVTDQTPAGAPQFNGVWMDPSGDAVAVGVGGAVWTRTAGTWAADEDAPVSRRDWHAVYRDPKGGVWTVGGQVVVEPFDDGWLGYRGEAPPAGL